MNVGADVVLCMQLHGAMMDTWKNDWLTHSFILELGVPFIKINLKLKSEEVREERKKRGGTESKESKLCDNKIFFFVLLYI